MSEVLHVEFVASLPPIDSAMERSRRGRGLLIKLETPESEIGATCRLNLWVEEIFAASLVRRDDNAKLNFIAAIENSDRALMRSGNGNGRKIQLRVPESEVGNAIELEGWAQKTFIVTLRVLNEKERIEFEAGQKSAAQKGGIGNGSGIATPRRTSAKRRERSSD